MRELLLKEWHLQRTGLLTIPLTILLWVGLWLLSFKADMPLASGGTLGDWLEFLSQGPAAVLLIAVPALLGANAVASERQLGTAAWQLGQPISARWQWRVKLTVNLLLALLSAMLGVLLHWQPPTVGHESGNLQVLIPWLLPWSCLALTAGLFGSRHARGSFQALGLALVFSAGMWFVWGLLRFTSHVASTLWPFEPAAVLRMGSHYGIGLVDVVFVGMLWALAWTMPRQEEWIAERAFLRSRGLATLTVVAAIALTAQLLLFTWTRYGLEREVAARDAEIAHLGGTSSLDWLGRELRLPGPPLSVDELPEIIDLGTYIVLSSERPHFYNYYAPLRQPESRFMNLAVWADGASRRKIDRWYWLRDRSGLLYNTYEQNPIEGGVPLRGVRSRWHAFSIAPLWLQHRRRTLLDRRVRQNVTLEAIRTGRQLERLHARGPETFHRWIMQFPHGGSRQWFHRKGNREEFLRILELTPGGDSL